MKAMWQWSSSHCSSEEPAIRAEACLAADVTPSSAAFNASNSRIQRQKVSRAKPSICEFKPSKLQKVEVCFIPRLLLPELICIHASLLWLLCWENWTKLGEKKRKKEGENMVRIMRELLGLKWVSPPLLAAPAFDWNPQIHTEFRFALLLFGGRVIADNQLRLLFLTGSHLSTVPSSRITLWGLQPVDPSFYTCVRADWLLMCLSCDNSSEICPFTARRCLSYLLASMTKTEPLQMFKISSHTGVCGLMKYGRPVTPWCHLQSMLVQLKWTFIDMEMTLRTVSYGSVDVVEQTRLFKSEKFVQEQEKKQLPYNRRKPLITSASYWGQVC